MKKFLLLIFISFSFRLFAQTNVYHPFPDSNAVWNIHISQMSCVANYSIIITGDTLVGGKAYHKLTIPYVQSTGLCGPMTGYKGGIRQEIVNRKVFFMPPSSSTEQLLYDFNMQVGDTVKGYIETGFYSMGTTAKVQSIDSVLVGSTYRKRWHNQNVCFIFWFIEGIGSLWGLIEQDIVCKTDEPNYSITCFQQNGITLYPDTITNCQLLTSTLSIDKNSNEVKISPNPSTGIFTITSSEKFQYSVYDVFGREVFQSTNSSVQSTTLDLSSYPKGIYFMRIKSGEIIFSRKIVLQ